MERRKNTEELIKKLQINKINKLRGQYNLRNITTDQRKKQGIVNLCKDLWKT